MRRLLLSGALLALSACSPTKASLDIEITTGREKGAFDADPAVTEVDITATPLSGDSATLKATAKPGGSFDLGDATSTDPYTIEVTGKTATGEVVMQGRSLAVAPDALAGGTYEVFCQRVDAWARPPGELLATHVGGASAIASERFLMLAGGSRAIAADGSSASVAQGEFYDLVTLSGGAPTEPLPRTPETIVGLGDVGLLIDGQGATWLSFTDGSTGEASPPTGLHSFGDLAGGRALLAPDGRTFVIGATRSSSPTAAVLVIATDGTLSALSLAHPRAQAAAAWVDGDGLVISGGAGAAPGVEVLPDGQSSFVTRPYPHDGTVGAGVGTSSSGVFVVGGIFEGNSAPTRRIDPACTDACESTIEPSLALPAELIETQVFAIDGGHLVAVGREPTGGHARAFELDVGGKKVTELVLREPRTAATFTTAPNGTLAVLGGLHDDGSPALTVETLFPR